MTVTLAAVPFGLAKPIPVTKPYKPLKAAGAYNLVAAWDGTLALKVATKLCGPNSIT